ncbi:MAG: hypothetical protein ABR551_02485 [Gemmatimonadales bacterium]
MPILLGLRQDNVMEVTMGRILRRAVLLLSVSLSERARVSLEGDVANLIREWIAPAGR